MTFPILTLRISITSSNPSQRFYPCFSLKELVNCVVVGGNLDFFRSSLGKEIHKGKSQKTCPTLTKEKVNKSKLSGKPIKATAPNSQRKANIKTKKLQQNKSKAKMTQTMSHSKENGNQHVQKRPTK
jgi:hypothetical protein